VAENHASQILQYFDEKELMAIREVCKNFRAVAERYLGSRFLQLQGVSSLLYAQYSKNKTLRERIVERIAYLKLRGGTVRIASDQITSGDFFNSLLGPSLTIVVKVNIGSKGPQDKVAIKGSNALQVTGPPGGHGKAHPKFMTGGGGVMLQSANYTPSGLSGNTVESGVFIGNLRVQAFFNHYFDLMRGHSVEERNYFSKALEAFNTSSQFISLALAPFVSIQPWLKAQFESSPDRLIIRMFLVSYLRKGEDIVTWINSMARKNPKMTVEVYVDQGQYDDNFEKYFRGSGPDRQEYGRYYVQEACNRLMAGVANVRIFTQTGSSGIMHDKLILAEKDVLNSIGQTVTYKRLIVGSSGFSTHVMNNENYDIMVRLDNNGLYDYMMQHHGVTVKNKAFNTKPVGTKVNTEFLIKK
jgi:hypothetical protein